MIVLLKQKKGRAKIPPSGTWALLRQELMRVGSVGGKGGHSSMKEKRVPANSFPPLGGREA